MAMTERIAVKGAQPYYHRTHLHGPAYNTVSLDRGNDEKLQPHEYDVAMMSTQLI